MSGERPAPGEGPLRPSGERPAPEGAPLPLLLLWDIDGTLLLRASEEHGAALEQALTEVHGIGALGDHGVSYAGRTDRAITRDLLAAGGVSGPVVEERVPAVLAAAASAYAVLCPPDLSERVAPGVAGVLAELAARPAEFRLALLTGNVEAIAHRKLDRAGIGSFFPPGWGAFGSDAERREELPAIARKRAGGWLRERTVVIGDTPRDVACARADGVRVIGVATGPASVEELAAADAVARDARGVLAVLEAWA